MGDKTGIALIHQEIVSRETLFAKLLPEGMSAKRFALIAYSHVRKNKDLALCHPMNIVAEVSKAAELGLDFSIPNEVSLVPFKDRKNNTVSCSAIPGYKGYVKLARQGENVKTIVYSAVYSGDEFNVELGSDPKVVHRPVYGEKQGELIAFYALGLSKVGGIYGPAIMSVDEVEKNAKRYIRAGFGPFGGLKTEGRRGENFIAYGLKTVLLQLCKRYLDLSAKGVAILQNDLKSMEQEKPQEPDVNAQVFGSSGVDSDVVEAEWSLSDEPRPEAYTPEGSPGVQTPGVTKRLA